MDRRKTLFWHTFLASFAFTHHLINRNSSVIPIINTNQLGYIFYSIDSAVSCHHWYIIILNHLGISPRKGGNSLNKLNMSYL